MLLQDLLPILASGFDHLFQSGQAAQLKTHDNCVYSSQEREHGEFVRNRARGQDRVGEDMEAEVKMEGARYPSLALSLLHSSFSASAEVYQDAADKNHDSGHVGQDIASFRQELHRIGKNETPAEHAEWSASR